MKNTASVSDLFYALAKNMSAAEIKTAFVTADISTVITKERIARKMTQKEFADFMGVSQPMISKWESGDYNFTISSIAEIFDKLELDFDFKIISKQTEEINIEYTSGAVKSLPSIIDLKKYIGLTTIA